MATLEKLVLDAKRISSRLNDKLVLGDSLMNEIEFVNEQLKTLKTVSRFEHYYSKPQRLVFKLAIPRMSFS